MPAHRVDSEVAGDQRNMSETNKEHARRLILPFLPAVLLVGLVSAFGASPASSESLSDYGAKMCADAGIPADACSLSDKTVSERVGSAEAGFDNYGFDEPAVGDETAARASNGVKSETLVGRGRWLCEQQDVPLEDCRALPLAHRAPPPEILPASSFLTVPERLPQVDGVVVSEPLPVQVVAPPPVPVQEPAIGFLPPPVLPAEPSFREVAPLPAAEPVFRDARVPRPRNDFGFRPFREPRPPIEPSIREVRERRPPVEPVVREVRQGPVDDDGPGFFGRWFDGRQADRCRREVRYTRPPSYRYIECF